MKIYFVCTNNGLKLAYEYKVNIDIVNFFINVILKDVEISDIKYSNSIPYSKEISEVMKYCTDRYIKYDEILFS